MTQVLDFGGDYYSDLCKDEDEELELALQANKRIRGEHEKVFSGTPEHFAYLSSVHGRRIEDLLS